MPCYFCVLGGCFAVEKWREGGEVGWIATIRSTTHTQQSSQPCLLQRLSTTTHTRSRIHFRTHTHATQLLPAAAPVAPTCVSYIKSKAKIQEQMARDSLLLWGAGLSAAALLYYIVVGPPGESGKGDGGEYFAGLCRGLVVL